MENIVKQDIKGLDELLTAITIAQQLAERVEVNVSVINRDNLHDKLEEIAAQNSGMISLEVSEQAQKARDYLTAVFDFTQQVAMLNNEHIEDLTVKNGGTTLTTSIVVKALRN